MTGPRYEVGVAPIDGNAWNIMGATTATLRRVLRERGWASGDIAAELDKYRKEAMAGNYDHLLQTTMAWVDLRPSDEQFGERLDRAMEEDDAI